MAFEDHENRIAQLAAENGDFATKGSPFPQTDMRLKLRRGMQRRKRWLTVVTIAAHLALIGALFNVQPGWFAILIYIMATIWSIAGHARSNVDEKIAFLDRMYRRR